MASTSSSGRREQERDPFLVLEPPNKKMRSFSPKLFDVFINHRGPDVKTTLALQLYNSLNEDGIQAYLDSEETELGDSFSTTIKNAIFSAVVHIAILSPRYTESAWCLAELALMFQTGARIIPLFYLVKPSDFRHIKNKVAEGFSKHNGRFPYHDIQQWKECLQNISGIEGYELKGQNDDLNKLCNVVVSAVKKEKQRRKIPFQVAKYEVGLDDLLEDFHSHCERNGQMIDKIIGIFGMEGSGKTTLVKYLFNHKHSEFSGSTSLFDVREKHVKGELTSLQSKLLNDLFCGNHYKFYSIEDGTACIKDCLQRSRESRFLIVIDNVDHMMQLDALLPIDTLNPKSLVIVTTRDERLLIQAGVRVRYKMKEMNAEHSRQLFCWHAFHTQSCEGGFENLVDSFVEVCGGLPLALQVMGAHVFGSDKGYWKLQLDNVKARLHRDIKDRLKISYDALEEGQKQIFVDMWSFMRPEPRSDAFASLLAGDGGKEFKVNAAAPSYVPIARSRSSFSNDRLQLCTEGLGCGSGDCEDDEKFEREEIDSSYDEDEENFQREDTNLSARSFPPALTTLRGSRAAYLRSFKKDGRFVLQSVKTPLQNFLHSHREGGRFIMHLVIASNA